LSLNCHLFSRHGTFFIILKCDRIFILESKRIYCNNTRYFFNKIYLQYVNTLTSVLDSTKIVPGQPISCRTLAVRGGHGTTSSGYGRYSSEKMAQKKKHCSRRVRNQHSLLSRRIHGKMCLDVTWYRHLLSAFETNTT
jgi:hypothetical protein